MTRMWENLYVISKHVCLSHSYHNSVGLLHDPKIGNICVIYSSVIEHDSDQCLLLSLYCPPISKIFTQFKPTKTVQSHM